MREKDTVARKEITSSKITYLFEAHSCTMLRHVVYVNNGENIFYICPHFVSFSPFLFLSPSQNPFFSRSRSKRQCQHSDLVFFQDSVLLKRELLKTATFNAPSLPGVWQWGWEGRGGEGVFFFLPALVRLVFFNFSPGTRHSSEASSGGFYRSSTRPVSLSLCRFPRPP